MLNIRVVLVAPKFEGNIGAIARSMANFDVEELYLVHPCEIGDEAYRRAKHGADILDNCKIVDSINEAVEDCFLVAGTSGVTTKGDKNYVRIPVSAHEFSEKVRNYDEKIAILFGREDLGLLQDELARCDVLIHIPSSETYPILNLSHAATIVLYELFGKGIDAPKPANNEEKERMFQYFEELLKDADYPPQRVAHTTEMFRRMMGRAIPSKYEYNTIMGVFGDASRMIKSKHNYPSQKKEDQS